MLLTARRICATPSPHSHHTPAVPQEELGYREVLEVLLPALELPLKVRELLLGCLDRDPEKRWSLERVRQHEVLQEGYRGLERWVRPLQVYLELVAPVDWLACA